MNVYKRLESLGIALTEPAIPAASYVPFVRSGDLVFLSGIWRRRTRRYWLADSVTA